MSLPPHPQVGGFQLRSLTRGWGCPCHRGGSEQPSPVPPFSRAQQAQGVCPAGVHPTAAPALTAVRLQSWPDTWDL